MTDFTIRLNKSGWEFTEDGDNWNYFTTALAGATGFRVKIGGWDLSSVSGQIVYFDNIEVSAIPEPGIIFLTALGGIALLRRRYKA